MGRANTANRTVEEDHHDSLVPLLAPILQTSLENTIGDLAWTSEDLKEQKVRSLHLAAARDAAARQEQQDNIRMDHTIPSTTTTSSEEALQTLLQEMTRDNKKEPTRDVVPGSAAASASVEMTQDADGNAVVKRRKFAII
eukprot:scaffold190696_cov34-Attheya_sp.AAC.1